MLSTYISKNFLSILAVPNKTDFCTIPTFNLIPSVSIHPLKPLLLDPRAPATASTFFSDQILFSSLFKFCLFNYQFNLFHFFLMYLIITWYSNIDNEAWFRLSIILPTKIKSGLLASIALSHWIFISQINLTSSSSTAPSGQCSYYFPFLSRLCFWHNFQWTNFATVSCLLLYSRCASFLHSHFICCTVSPLTPHILHNGFSYVLSILFFVWFVLNTCPCAEHIVASVCTLRSLCTNHFQDKSLSISGISRTSFSQAFRAIWF